MKKVTRMRKRVTRSVRNAEEGYEEVWDEVQEALLAMEHEEFDDTTEADCARSQASRPSSAASSQASVRS